MPPTPSCHRHGPVAWAWLPHAPRAPGEALARGWLGAQLGVDADAVELVRDARGRPRLAGTHAGLDCNWSHSGDGLVVALADGVDVGVDLERERPRPRALDLANRFFAAAERDWLAAQPDAAARERAFVRLWCAKEAVLKAHGLGLVFGLHRLRFAERDGALALAECDAELGPVERWTVHELRPADGYVGALAWRAR
ncbi:MAG: 4'-phosphopantetheinyl transferase superfamily protein [Pseudomonas sp.]|nr:4'-phosphopantetheinyl transferase superfamily protein [Pseudomonas sp.]